MYERTEMLKVRVTPDEKRRLRERAARAGFPEVSAWVRQALLADAEEEVVPAEEFDPLGLFEETESGNGVPA